jgi:glycosyltransferase involved in cell wall biosynthesis
MAAHSDASADARPLVSVILLTYNHEPYIQQALESVLGQGGNISCEVLVAEDYSTDRTREILKEMLQRYPGRFELLDRGRNLGLSANLEDAWKRCRGKYIAILEGDDYWCDSHKLARVTAALETHPEWVGCFHAVRILNATARSIVEIAPEPFPDRPIRFEDLLRRTPIATYSSVTYRAGLIREFPREHRGLASGDWLLHLLHAEQGDFGFLPEVMTAYRAHPAGMASGMTEAERWAENLRFWERIDRYYDGRHAAAIRAARGDFLREMQTTLDDLRKIERRYLTLRLDRVAAAGRAVRGAATRLFGIRDQGQR